MVNVLFSRARGPVQTYGKIQLMLVDALGINETFNPYENNWLVLYFKFGDKMKMLRDFILLYSRKHSLKPLIYVPRSFIFQNL